MPNLSSEPPVQPEAKVVKHKVERLDPETVRRVLVLRPRFLGDICLTLPVLDHLRRHAPHAVIDYLTEEPYAPLVEGDPRLAAVIRARRTAKPTATASLLSRLALAGYDLVLDLFCNPRTALLTAATRARVRVGYPGKGWRSVAYNRFAHARAKSSVSFHLASIEALGWEIDPEAVPALHLEPSEREAARARLASLGIPVEGARLVTFHPGARWPTRRWGAARYAEVARLLLERDRDAWALILAGPGEAPLAQSIVEQVTAASGSGARILALPPLGTRELAAQISVCHAFVGADSGPLHVSVAAGTPTIGIFGRNEPARFFPYPLARGHRAVYAGVWCSPCHLDVCSHTSCLAALSPRWVWEALSEVLEPRRPEVTAAGASR